MSNTKIIATLGAALVAIALLAAPAAAATLVDFSNPAFAPVTGPTSIPIGAAEFCKRNRADCAINSNDVAAESLDGARWQQLVDINDQLNASIVPETDEDLYHVAEYWTYPDGSGDCEDIALAKRRQLIGSGWDASTLLMTVVREANGDGHAVLMVRTDRGDLVLDNQDSQIRVWSDTPYQFIKRQSQANPGQWVGIADDHPLIVAARN